MEYDVVINLRAVVSIVGFLLLSPLGMVVVSQLGGQMDSALAREYTLCECVNEPIKTDEKARACGELTERLGPEVVATETMKCRETLAIPSAGVDFCFCMRSTSQDPEIQRACLELASDISPRELHLKTQECARKPYQ